MTNKSEKQEPKLKIHAKHSLETRLRVRFTLARSAREQLNLKKGPVVQLDRTGIS